MTLLAAAVVFRNSAQREQMVEQKQKQRLGKRKLKKCVKICEYLLTNGNINAIMLKRSKKGAQNITNASVLE